MRKEEDSRITAQALQVQTVICLLGQQLPKILEGRKEIVEGKITTASLVPVCNKMQWVIGFEGKWKGGNFILN